MKKEICRITDYAINAGRPIAVWGGKNIIPLIKSIGDVIINNGFDISKLPTKGNGILVFEDIEKYSYVEKEALCQLLMRNETDNYCLPEGWSIFIQGNDCSCLPFSISAECINVH